MLKYLKKHRHRILLIIGLIVGAYRLRYFLGANVPLGYDPGIYKKIFETYSIFFQTRDFSVFPSWMKHEPVLPFLANIFHSIGISYDRLVTRGIGIISLLPGIWLFLIFRKHNKLLAVLAPLLYRISITQYEVFRRNYFKQIVGINIMLGVLYSFSNNKHIGGSILFLLLLLTHRHTSLYTGGILVFWFVTQTIQHKKIPRKQISILGTIGALALIVYIPMWDKLISDGVGALTSTINSQGYGGIFFGKTMYNIVTLPVILLSLGGIFLKFKNRKIDVRVIGYIIGIIRIGLGLVNFNRTLPFRDIFIIIMAAYCLQQWIDYNKKFGWGVTSIVILYTTIFYVRYISTHATPLINQQQFDSINSLATSTPSNAIIMVTDRRYTARMIGYSQRDWIAPGWSDINKRKQDGWNQRWGSNGPAKCTMLKEYNNLNQPIYLRIGHPQIKENLSGATCLEKVEQKETYQLWKYIQ